jgi:hypothetical protein
VNKTSIVGSNRYTFHCPVVDRNERFLACAFRKHRKWRGESIDAEDCSVVMNASKCPAVHMLELEHREGRAMFFDSAADEVHKLPSAILDRIARILVLPFHGIGTKIDPETLSALVGRKVELPERQAAGSAETARKVPRSAARGAGGRGSQAERGSVLDHVEGDVAKQINKAIGS